MDIFDYFKKIQDSMVDTLSGSFSKINKSVSQKYKKPSCEISQGKDYLSIKVDLPEMVKRDVMLNITHDYLEVLAEKKSKRKGYKGYRRVISIPPGLVIDRAKAKFGRNKLTVKIPKLKTGKISVK